MTKRILTAGFAAALALVTACDLVEEKKKTAVLPGNAIVACTDYTATGSLATIDIAAKTASTGILKGSLNSDLTVRVSGGCTYVLNRTSGTVVRLDPGNGYTPVREVSVGTTSNPHDLVVGGSTAYVSLYGAASIAKLDAATLESRGSIDLSPYTDGTAGVPFIDRLYLDGTNLYVSLQRFTDSFYSTISCSQVLVIDTVSGSVTKAIDLKWESSGSAVFAKDPYSKFVYASASAWDSGDGHAHLFILCTGLYGETQSGGIVAIDTADLSIEPGFAVSESFIGAEICDFDFANLKFYIAADGASASELYAVNTAATSKTALTAYSSKWSMPFIKVNATGLLLIADGSYAAPGIRILDTAHDTFTTTDAISTDLPPYDIALSE